MPFNNEIYDLWQGGNQNERGDCIPKFVIEPPNNANANLLFFTFNGSRPQRVNQYFRGWMQNIGWIGNANNDYRARFEWEHSPLQHNYNQEEVNLSAMLHQGARGITEAGQLLYPRFFSRLNQLAGCIGMEPQHYYGLQLYDYAHVDLYFWLDSTSSRIRERLEETPQFADDQKTIAFRLLEAWRPKTIFCPYCAVRQDISCFCRTHGVIPNFQPLAGANGRVQIATTNLPWGEVMIIICQNFLGARGNVGVNAHDFPQICEAIAIPVHNFLGF